tara:strand:- start:472 stop:1011 length:540 start_codon:yes stop_codon:yes gene_type:complete
MKNITVHIHNSPFGELLVGDFENQLVLCDWKYRKMRSAVDKRIQQGLKAEYVEGKTALIEFAIEQIESYANGELKNFTLPLKFVGSNFQQSVWKALCEIPYGQTNSYLQLAQALGNPKAIIAVAAANGANALSIVVPCHRIIGSQGEMVGYAGGLTTKKKLLRLEGCKFISNQTQLFET